MDASSLQQFAQTERKRVLARVDRLRRRADRSQRFRAELLVLARLEMEVLARQLDSAERLLNLAARPVERLIAP